MYRMLVYLIVLIGISSPARTDELPVIDLCEGRNTVAITVVNKNGGNMFGMTAVVDKQQLPAWLTVESVPQVIDVRNGESGSNRLYLVFNVTEAPVNEETHFPLTFTDSSGNQWTFTATVRVVSGSPMRYELYENYPNPFNPATTIRYSLKETIATKLTIYNMLGQKIRTIVDEPQTAGVHTVQWNGRDEGGEQVSSGMYFYKLEAGSFVQTKRMMMVE